ncbi:beta-1,6-N-acetylglucosaminyltransferase enzyme [Micractinium conductrix]|uniref:Beta-1,6-N-acetylglucosaminyltransferase enzyme n=1 Tax=Micractinium conductrix TaxID=554055 RepID=A0A2P6V2X9_9CHLO|nr:beta-1,6-N-acetylglucosaminyltransferase enzyme [Micractinium conductrix]|eukprot:PSC68450.1 beta-1,6-N-acetylglucosaminyltransferase enzyme [Micractinium conductrix]
MGPAKAPAVAPPKFEFIPAREHGAVLPAAEAKLGELWRLLGAQRGRDGTLTYNPACNESSLVWTKGIKGDALRKRAVLKMPEVAESSTDGCAQALGVPKVALLFLIRGDLFHHHVWRRWFEAAAGQLPADAVHASLCRGDVAASPAGESAPGLRLLGGEEAAEEEDPEDAEQVAAACGWNATSGEAIPMGSGSGAGGVIAQQHLFSVYVHAPPGLTDDDLPELFRGHLITDRLQPEWGTHQRTLPERSPCCCSRVQKKRRLAAPVPPGLCLL